MTKALTRGPFSKRQLPNRTVYGFIMVDSPVVVRLSPSGNPFFFETVFLQKSLVYDEFLPSDQGRSERKKTAVFSSRHLD